MKTYHLGISGLAGFDPHPFRHIVENSRRFRQVPLRVGDIGHDAAAVLVSNGQPIFAVEEERLVRLKHFVGLPEYALAACMRQMRPEDKYYVSHYLDLNDKHLKRRILSCAPEGGDRAVAMKIEYERAVDATREVHASFQDVTPCAHHRSHAASAFFLSGFEHSLVLVVDGCGESASVSLYLGNHNQLEELLSLPVTSSLGIFYSQMTHFLGFEPIEDEYKIMGLAAYGADDDFADFFDEQIVWGRRQTADGRRQTADGRRQHIQFPGYYKAMSNV